MALSTRQWWRRATAAMKDKRSIYLRRVLSRNHRAEMEAAVICATSHDEHSVDYKNVARVFAWARTSPSCLDSLLCALTRRATRTRSWAVALKTLLLTHGVLICSTAVSCLGRLPFDLSDFRDSSSARPSIASYGFSAFVRAYFRFLDYRSVVFSSSISQFDGDSNSSYSNLMPPVTSNSLDGDLEMLVKMQDLLELLIQIQPYSNGMEVGLILEVMDCVIIEIFDVYGSICKGLASFLVQVLGSNSFDSGDFLAATTSSKVKMTVTNEERRRLGMAGMRVLRRAADQSQRLSSFFNLCRILGVHNATVIPPIKTIHEEDIRDLETVVHAGIPGFVEDKCYLKEDEEENNGELLDQRLETIVTKKWEIFNDGMTAVSMATPLMNNIGNTFCLEDENKLALSHLPWATPEHRQPLHVRW